MEDHITTYTQGFHMTYNRDITRKDFVQICKNLSCQPELRSGGGFLLMDNDNGYKTMTLHIENFPWIDHNILEEWANDTTILVPKKTKNTTTLKAFHGAPAWTIEELTLYKNILEEFGIKISKMPNKSDLIEHN